MVIYNKVKRFNPVTGEPVDKWGPKEIRCDYSGQVLDGGDDIYCCYQLDYEDRDPCLGSDGEEYKFGKEFNIDMFEFLSKTYHFYLWVAATATKTMPRKSEWYRCFTFDAMCRQARIRTARKLIQEGAIKPEQLEGSNKR